MDKWNLANHDDKKTSFVEKSAFCFDSYLLYHDI